MKPIRRDSIPHDSRSRDAALRRLRRINRWLIAGSAVLTGVFVDLAANAFSGHASSASAHKRAAKSTRHTSTEPLKPPAQAPKAAAPPATTETPPAAEHAPETNAPEAEAAPEAAPEPAPETREPETPAPERHEAAPAPASEPSEPVVSGGS
jgi:hypothetical protein